MGTVVLLEASAKTAAGDTAIVRLAGGGSYPYLGYGGASDWRSGLSGLPRFSTEVGFDETGPTGGAIPQTATVSFKNSDQAYNSALANLYWKGARVTVRSGDDTFGPATLFNLEMTGTVADVAFQDGGLQLTVADLSGDLGKPTAPDTFAGTGGVEGGDDASGRVKRRSWGRVFNVEGLVLDKANNIYEFGDPARPLQQFDMIKDKGLSGPMTVLAYQGSVAATFSALQAATAPSGGGVVAPSIAMVKWWTVPAGPLTADFRGETANGYAEDPATMVQRIVVAAAVAGISYGAAVNRTYPCGIHVSDASETVANTLDRLLLPVSLIWALSPAGALGITEFTWTGAVETLVSQDQIVRLSTYAPLLTRKLGFQRNYRTQSDAEIASVLLDATDITYADGTPIEVLKPAQAGADVTSGNTAAAITGQGAFATVSQAAYGSSLLTGFGQLSPLNSVAFGSNYLLETNGGVSATLNAFKTLLGIAASVTGQGSLATLSSLANGSQYLTGFGALSSLANVAFGTTQILEAQGGATATLAAFKTAQGTAASITGQGPWATTSQTVSSVVNPTPNRVFDGGLKLGGQKWTLSTWVVTVGVDGPYMSVSANAVTIATCAKFAVTAGLTYTVQAELYTKGASAGLLNIDLEWFNSAGASISTMTRASVPTGQDWATYSTSGVAPSNAVSAWMRVYIDSSPQTTFSAARRMKAAVAAERTVFSDEATNGALYATGQNIDLLKPAELGSNITETRTSAAITGQGTFATVSNIARANVANYFNFSAFQIGYSITRSDGTTTVTESLVVTSLGISGGFTGQGGLATKDQAGYTELNVADLTAQTSSTGTASYGGTQTPAVSYFLGQDMAVKSGGTFYISFSGGSVVTDGNNTSVYNSIDIFDTSNNLLVSCKLPFGGVPSGRLENYILMVPNSWGARTIRWRVATRGSNGGSPPSASSVSNVAVNFQWKAL